MGPQWWVAVLSSGTVVAVLLTLVNTLLNRRRAAAETLKVKAEVEQIRVANEASLSTATLGLMREIRSELDRARADLAEGRAEWAADKARLIARFDGERREWSVDKARLVDEVEEERREFEHFVRLHIAWDREVVREFHEALGRTLPPPPPILPPRVRSEEYHPRHE